MKINHRGHEFTVELTPHKGSNGCGVSIRDSRGFVIAGTGVTTTYTIQEVIDTVRRIVDKTFEPDPLLEVLKNSFGLECNKT